MGLQKVQVFYAQPLHLPQALRPDIFGAAGVIHSAVFVQVQHAFGANKQLLPGEFGDELTHIHIVSGIAGGSFDVMAAQIQKSGSDGFCLFLAYG